MPCRPGLSFASTPSLTVPDDYNLTIQCPGLHMPLNILGQGDHPTIGKRSHVYFIDCQVSTYRHISDAAKPITNNSDHSAAATALGLSSVLFGNSPGHAHFVRSDLLVPLEVSHPPLHSLQLNTSARALRNIADPDIRWRLYHARGRRDLRGSRVHAKELPQGCRPHMHMHTV